jgi:F-type H+-transporting ATPase subunit gamma
MNIRNVKKKIKSVTNVRKITKAMQLVSAVKMKKSQGLALDGKPYQEHLTTIIRKISQKIDPRFSRLITPASLDIKKKLTILISSNKGLCGAFNFNLFHFLVKNTDFKNNDFIALGKKGSFFVFRMGANIIADYSSNTPLTSVSAVFNLILEKFLNAGYASVDIVYNKFISTINSTPVRETVLPLALDKKSEDVEKAEKDYLIEPSPRKVIDPLLRSFVEQKIRYAIIESEASEHSARMMAMKNATDNANDVVYNLTLLGNRLRQEKITGELLDMVTAKESVEQD